MFGLKNSRIIKRITKSKRFEGCVDLIDRDSVTGWVWDRSFPENPLEVELLIGKNAVAYSRVENYREDLVSAGIGNGYHGFMFKLPNQLPKSSLSIISVRVKNSDFFLPKAKSIDGNPTKIGEEFLPNKVENLEQRLVGMLEIIAPHFVQGWARDNNNPTTPVSVQVFHNGEYVAEGFADEPRSGNDGFRFKIDLPIISPVKPEEFNCVALIDGSLTSLPCELQISENSWADFTVDNATTVTGWAARQNDGVARVIEILQDNEIVWCGPANRLISSHPIGFRVDLPSPVDWDNNVEISARFADTRLPFSRTVKVKPISRFVGYIDAASINNEILSLNGWVQNKARSLDNIDLDLLFDGEIVAQSKANVYREDLAACNIGNGGHGFEFRVNLQKDSEPQVIDIGVSECRAKIFTDIQFEKNIDDRAGKISSRDVVLVPEKVSSIVDGKLELVNYFCASGWARYQEAPDKPVLLDLYIDNCYYCSTLTGRHRADVANKFADHGNHGFYFELKPHIATGKDLNIRVTPRFGQVAFSSSIKMLGRRPDGIVLNPPPVLANLAKVNSQNSLINGGKVAYIVLNLNGEALLRNLFESFSRHNRYSQYEILIVDHGSSDGSLELCKEWEKQLNVRVFARGENFSFSASNNFGASQTDADVLVFLNNDIVFIQDVGAEIVHLLGDESIGIVGIKLLDPPAFKDDFSPTSIQHLGVHFHWKHRTDFIHPFETRYAPHLRNIANDVSEVPVVTGALMACRRNDFLSASGFDETYFYGYEDVDLCLREVLESGRRVVCANHISAYHMRGYSRGNAGEGFSQRLINNNARLQEKFGTALRRAFTRDRFSRPAYWTGFAPRIAFAVTEASDSTAAGDYFTALELAREIVEEFPCQVIFLDKQENWYDLAGVDVLVVMRDDYNLRELKNQVPHLLRIGWARNWIDRWAEREWSQDYDLIWASSQRSADYLSQRLARSVEVVRIATNIERFRNGKRRDELVSDYCFTGSYFGSPREIVYYLDPAALPFDCAVFGHGWDAVPNMAPFSRGPLPYSDMPDVYASTKIVIDDANSATKQWGSVNSRVFDALAAGALVITNGKEGATELFGDLLPTYSTTQELEQHLRFFLSDDTARNELVAKLQERIDSLHTYNHRAKQVISSICNTSAEQLRFSIKIGTPSEEVREEWGDYHFALGLKRALTRMGHTVRIDCLNKWEGGHCLGDDVVIVLRGLSAYTPKSHQINIMWNISHPKAVSLDEYEKYDHVFVASTSYSGQLAEKVSVPVSTLLQCTDPELFSPETEPLDFTPEVLFVGNSRNLYRKIVKDAVKLNLPLEVHGSRWEQFLPSSILKTNNIQNSQLGSYYRSAKVVLNDHWDDMREYGFISNRIFDVAASGGFIITDKVAGVDEIFGDSVSVVQSKSDLDKAVRLAYEEPTKVTSMKIKASKIVLSDHTFDRRVEMICHVVDTILCEGFRRQLGS